MLSRIESFFGPRWPISLLIGLCLGVVLTSMTQLFLQSKDDLSIAENSSTDLQLVGGANPTPGNSVQQLQLTNALSADPLGFIPDSETGSEFPSLQYALTASEFALDPQSWIEDQVQKGDTFVEISLRNGISYSQALNMANISGAEILHKIKPGKTIRFQIDSKQRLSAIQYAYDSLETFEIRRDHETGDYLASILNHTPEVRVREFKGTINSSIFKTAQSNDIPSSVIGDFVSIYQWKVDFYRDIKEDDKFSIIFEELYVDGNRIGTGKLVAAELDSSGQKIQAIRYTDPEGHTDYYSQDGESLRTGFLRSPLKFARVSSHFSDSRLHPISKKRKPHRGVDYSAPMGTPVMATGGGKVTKAGFMNGYGITVVIKHSNKYESLYAHLSKISKGIKPGFKVEQGQIIGYVGSTGISTGPHLHYEFKIDGIHQDAVTVKLPNAKRVNDHYLSDFNKVVANTLEQLAELDQIQLAHSPSASSNSGG